MHIDLNYYNAISNNVAGVSDSLNNYDFDFGKCNFEGLPLLYLLSDDFFRRTDLICDYDSLKAYAFVFNDKTIYTDLDMCTLLNLRVVGVEAGIVFVEFGGAVNGR